MSFILFCHSAAYGAGTITSGTASELSAALQGGGLVTFNFDGIINLTSTITITNDTMLDASDHAVTLSGFSGTNAGNAVRVFNVNTGVNFTLINLTLANGSSTNGGAIFINTNGNVTATNCIFSGNSAIGINGLAGADGSDQTNFGDNGARGGNGGHGLGGAIYNLGEVTLGRCIFQTNTATGGTGGAGGSGGSGGVAGNGGSGGNGGNGYGGAIYSLGAISVSNCTYANNTTTGGNGANGGSGGTGTFPGLTGDGGSGGAGFGAGLYCLGPSVVVSSIFSDNSTQGGNSATGGQAENGNGLNGHRGGDSLGGGMCNLGTNTMTNCTFFANKVTGGAGGNGGDGGVGGNGGNGGLASGGGFYNSGSTVVNYCTFSSGSAIGGTNGLGGNGVFPGTDGNSGAKRGGNVARNSGGFTLKNSIVAYSASGNNGFGTFIDGGHNLSSDGSPGFSTGVGSTNHIDPKLGSLANDGGFYGGFTLTVPLLAGSPAIDAADGSDCPAFDQRGKPRPSGLKCDIGAYEFEPTFNVQGEITEGTNGVSDITITAGPFSATSDTNGNYFISNLVANTYTVTPQPAGTGFNPAGTNVTLGPSATNVNFVLNRVQITAIAPATNGLFQLSFLGGPNRTYRIEASTNLTDWQTVSTNMAQTNGVFQFIDGYVSNFPIRFYRTVTP